MPLMILGAFATLINNLPIPAYINFMNSVFSKTVGKGAEKAYIWTKFGGNAWSGTFAILSVFIVFLVAYNLGKSYNINPLAAGVTALGSFFAVGGLAGMDSMGLFVALIVAMISTEILRRLLGNKHLVIKMPDGVPPAITANLNAIKAGKAAPYIVNKPFFDSSVNLGGTGATLGLIIAIWLVGRKNKQYSIVGNLSAAPGVFNINEPLTFGLQSY